jgi:F420-dependent oxidoreductase-like protein
MELRIMIEPQNGASYEQQLALAQAAERYGFGAFFRSDHYLGIQFARPPGPTDSWVTLGALARETQTIRLGTMVTSATFRLPGPLAVTVAQVDVMSGGRVELGLGTGWYEAEHRAYGIPFPAVGERFERLEEQLAILTGMWATGPGEMFSHAGRHYQLENSPALPHPAQPEGPPIIIGGGGPRRTPRLAARFASEFNMPFADVQRTGEQFERVRAACEQAGRDPAELHYSHAVTVCCGSDEAQARARAERVGKDLDELRREQAGGTPDEVIEQLSAFASTGAQRSYLQLLDIEDLDHLALLGEQVMPQLAGS